MPEIPDTRLSMSLLQMKSNLGAADLGICKTCLAMDVKLYSLKNKLLKDCNKILSKFHKDIDGLPDYMCYKCVALLIKSYNFIQKSINSKNILLNIHKEYGTITKDLVSNNTSELSTNSSLTFNKVMPTTIYDMQYDEDLDKYNYIITTNNENNIEFKDINNTEVLKYDNHHTFIDLDGIKNDNCEVIRDGDDDEYIPDDGSYDSEENLTLNVIKNEAKTQNVRKKKPTIKRKNKKSRDISNAQDINLEKYFKIVKLTNVRKKKPTIKRKNKKSRDISNAQDINLEKYFKIVKLTLEEQITEREKMKESPAYRDALYRCEVCYRTYMNPDSFKQHVGQHHSSRGGYECPVCKIRYATDALARWHTTRAHGRIFHCKICPKRFVTANSAKRHHERHEGRNFKCADCDFSTIYRSAMYSHIKLLHGTRFRCSECGHKFRSEKGLRLHTARMHRIKQIDKVDSLFVCYNCGTNFISEAKLQKHSINCQKADGKDSIGDITENGVLNTTEEQYPIQCEHCELSMTTRRDHYFHVRKYHRNELDSYQPVITAVCTICGRGFQNATKLHVHELRHVGRASVHCPHCERMFYDKYQLARHIGVHSDARPYKCTQCDKTFKLKSNMTRHLQVHSSAFPYECNMCGKRFSYSSSRNLHIKTVHYKMPQPPRKKRNSKCARNSTVNSYDNF